MFIRQFDVHIPRTFPPASEGWGKMWDGFYGYYAMTRCVSKKRQQEWEDLKDSVRKMGEIELGGFQQVCLLSILADIKQRHVTVFELGAGWARLCLAIAGAIDHRVIPLVPTNYTCLAVEAEPTHFRWAQEHFSQYSISGTVIHGAVSDRNGKCRFDIGPEPD